MREEHSSMDLAFKVLGSTAVGHLSKLSAEAVLIVGRDKLTRADLAGVECFNFVAARNLSAACKALGVESLRDLYETTPPRDLALPHIGVVALAVLGAAFEARKIGGENPLETYVRKHAPKLTTFHSIKAKELRDQRAATKARRRRNGGSR